MKKNNTTPTLLIEQFLQGQLNSAKEQALLDWIDQDAGNLELFQKEQERLRSNISQNSTYRTDEQWNQILAKIKKQSINRRHRSKWLRIGIRISAAAAILVFALIISNVFKSNDIDKASITYNTEEVTTPFGEKTSIILSDGTKVNLNSGSKLVFPTEFSGKSRIVKLFGEAFFEVSPNKEKPFIVQTHGLNVRVLGTAFNVEAFPDVAEISTTLVHGKVLLEKEVNNQTTELSEMQPNERAVYRVDNQEFELRKEANVEQYIAWKDGKLVFMQTSIEEVAKKLELWYNVRVNIENEDLKKSHFTGTFTDENIEQVLKLLKISFPMNYTITELDNSMDEDLPVYEIVLTKNN